MFDCSPASTNPAIAVYKYEGCRGDRASKACVESGLVTNTIIEGSCLFASCIIGAGFR
jgi:hypothetical protein